MLAERRELTYRLSMVAWKRRLFIILIFTVPWKKIKPTYISMQVEVVRRLLCSGMRNSSIHSHLIWVPFVYWIIRTTSRLGTICDNGCVSIHALTNIFMV